MKIGFVSAILPEYTLEQVLSFAHQAGFASVELMCWPPGKSERRYAGVTHLDATNLAAGAIEKVRDLVAIHRVAISGLGYYPNPLSPDQAEAEVVLSHLRTVIDAAAALEVRLVNTFVGRDPALPVDANWARFLEVWRPLISHAEGKGVKIGIENCPMLFTGDEWPGGKNLATTPGDLAEDVPRHPQPLFRPEFRSLALDLAADGLHRSPGRVQGPDFSCPRQGRQDRPRRPRSARGPVLSQAVAHAQDPRSGRRPLGCLPRRARAMPATKDTSRSRSRIAPSKARSNLVSTRSKSAAVICFSIVVASDGLPVESDQRIFTSHQSRDPRHNLRATP